MQESLELRIARQRVHDFTDEALRQHDEALDCWDCQTFLQLGIDAFDWLIRADREVRMSIYQGRLQHDPQIDEAIQALCRAWLRPCDEAEKWLAIQQSRGYTIENLERFQECRAEMQAIVEANESHAGEETLPAPIAALRDEAIQEHLDGQTAEYV